MVRLGTQTLSDTSLEALVLIPIFELSFLWLSCISNSLYCLCTRPWPHAWFAKASSLSVGFLFTLVSCQTAAARSSRHPRGGEPSLFLNSVPWSKNTFNFDILMKYSFLFYLGLLYFRCYIQETCLIQGHGDLLLLCFLVRVLDI